VGFAYVENSDGASLIVDWKIKYSDGLELVCKNPAHSEGTWVYTDVPSYSRFFGTFVQYSSGYELRRIAPLLLI
jgi:hypothetical protein